MTERLLRLSPLMRRALLEERDGRLPVLEGNLRSRDEREKRGAERTKMALVERGLLKPAPFRCELTEAGAERVKALRLEEQKRQHRAMVKAAKMRHGLHPRWGEAAKAKLTPRWGKGKGRPAWERRAT